MTARDIVAAVERAGGSVQAVAGDRIRVHAPAAILNNALKIAIGEQKPELLRLLSVVDQASDIARAAMLSCEGRWLPALAVCDFLIGRVGEDCKRCTASWREHYPKD